MKNWPLVLACFVVGACSDSPSSPDTGSIDVAVSGLPTGVSAAVTITGGGGFSRTVTASGKVDGVPAGSYTVAATSVTNAGATYDANPASQAATVTAGQTTPVVVAYSAGADNILLRYETVATGLTSPVYVTSPPGDTR